MLKIAAINEIPHLKPQEPVSNRGCCSVILKIVAAVAKFFRTAWLWVGKTIVGLKDRAIDLLPERIAMRLDPRRIFVRTVLNIASDQRAAVLQKALPRISPQMDRDTRDQLVQVVKNESSAHLSRSMLRFVTPDMYSYDSIKTTAAIAAVPTEQRDAVILYSDQLVIKGGLPRTYRTAIIEAITAIPAQEREAVVARAQQLIMGGRMPHSIIQAMAARVDRLITPATRDLSIEKICESVAFMSGPEREEVVRKTALFIVPTMDGSNIAQLIRIVANIPAKERETVTALALEVITPDMGPYSRERIIKAVAAVPAPEREKIYRNALLLITPTMDEIARSDMIQAIAAVPSGEREIVAMFAFQVLEGAENPHFRQETIEVVAAIPAMGRDDVMQHALQLINRNMDVQDRVAIIRSTAAVPDADRLNVMQHALQLINPNTIARDIATIIGLVAALPIHQRANYVQARQGGHVVQNAQAAHGMDVHEGRRDRRIKAALERIQQHQGSIPRNKIDQAVKEFTKYLNDHKMKDQNKRLAQRALLTPRVLRGDDFGPLIGGESFSILGLVISGHYLIGRLWIFASKLQEPDQTNAKDGMISALKDSYQMDGFSRVCNQGKTQRLVVAVLQGRLAGVDIELTRGMQVPTRQAVGMFFNVEAHQKIEQIAPLLAAANKFCDENPAVNRDSFIQEIRAYAEAQGFQN